MLAFTLALPALVVCTDGQTSSPCPRKNDAQAFVLPFPSLHQASHTARCPDALLQRHLARCPGVRARTGTRSNSSWPVAKPTHIHCTRTPTRPRKGRGRNDACHQEGSRCPCPLPTHPPTHPRWPDASSSQIDRRLLRSSSPPPRTRRPPQPLTLPTLPHSHTHNRRPQHIPSAGLVGRAISASSLLSLLRCGVEKIRNASVAFPE